MVFLLFGLFLLFAEAPAKVEPIPVDGLIEQVAGIKQSLITDAAKEAAVSISLAKSLAENHIVDVNKMVDPQPSPSDKHEKAKREIIIFTRPNCPPCDQWKRCEQAKFESDGWVVAYCTEHNFGLTPTFVIEKNGRSTEHRGYLPFAKIDEVTR